MSAGGIINAFRDDDVEHNITAADLTINASVAIVAPGGTDIRGFAENDAVTADTYENGVVRMGVDGVLAAGFKHAIRYLGIMMLPTGEFYRNTLIDCLQAEEQLRRKLRWDMDITYPAINMTYHCHKGYIMNAKDLPDAKEVLENVNVRWAFQWVLPSKISSIYRPII